MQFGMFASYCRLNAARCNGASWDVHHARQCVCTALQDGLIEPRPVTPCIENGAKLCAKECFDKTCGCSTESVSVAPATENAVHHYLRITTV